MMKGRGGDEEIALSHPPFILLNPMTADDSSLGKNNKPHSC
jgi:hypothetical protein